jgi:hypothetical protein
MYKELLITVRIETKDTELKLHHYQQILLAFLFVFAYYTL